MDATVVKVGGSLASYPEKLRALCAKLAELSQRHRLIVVPGGGEFADVVRDLDRRFSLSPSAAHRMAILGMDQYGLLLSDLLPNSCAVTELDRLRETLDLGKLPVFLPSTFMFAEGTLESSWDVTSDSIAVHIAGCLHATRTILVTDVDGVYTCDPKKSAEAKLIEKLPARELSRMGKRSSVDRFLPKLLLQLQAECFVVNGLYPERVEAILKGQVTTCTLITGKP
jgi:aspartokinase-like uncharacterized kinase